MLNPENAITPEFFSDGVFKSFGFFCPNSMQPPTVIFDPTSVNESCIFIRKWRAFEWWHFYRPYLAPNTFSVNVGQKLKTLPGTRYDLWKWHHSKALHFLMKIQLSFTLVGSEMTVGDWIEFGQKNPKDLKTLSKKNSGVIAFSGFNISTGIWGYIRTRYSWQCRGYFSLGLRATGLSFVEDWSLRREDGRFAVEEAVSIELLALL
jgi:hypothetical protein